MSWAARRRFLYLLVLFLIIAGLTLIPTYIHFKQPPTCFDGKQNQGESDIDKGGPCNALDENSLIPLSVQWTRAFETKEGIYNGVAYIENANEGAGVKYLSYEMRLYDARNVLVAVRQGKTFVMPGSVTPIFEARIESGHRVVTHAFLDISDPEWVRATDSARTLIVENKKSSTESTAPRIDAVVHSNALSGINHVSVVGVVFDTAGNAFAASKTEFDRINPGEVKDISYTWPLPWTLAIGRIDIYPVVEPDWAK